MVEYKEKETWTCTYCNNEYDDYDKAYGCAVECVDIEPPTSDTQDVYVCEGCKKEFEDEDEAEECEKYHKEHEEDKHHNQMNLLDLKKAGEHQTQKKLVCSSE